MISLACYLPPCPKPTYQAVSCCVDPTSLALVSGQHPLGPIPLPQTWKSVDSSDDNKESHEPYLTSKRNNLPKEYGPQMLLP